MTTKQRIWELDAFRGLCVLGMIVVHFVYDLTAFGGLELEVPYWVQLIQNYGNLFFILLSGICATLAGRSFKRGVVVFGAGLLISYATLFMEYVLGFQRIAIWFGVLHLLGVSMMLFPLLRKLPHWAMLLLGAALAALGYWMATVEVGVPFLFPLGLRQPGFFTGSDYFPLLPFFGWFVIGAGLGKLVYRRKQSLLPRVNADFFLLRFLCFVGRHSLEIYLLHQPILSGITALLFS